jgi:hypothetical protein
MSTQIKTRRGTTAEHSTFTGSEAEITVDTTLDTIVVHDGVTAGGFPLAKASDIVASDASTKLPLAGGALTGNVTTTGTFDGRDVSVDGTKLDTLIIGSTVQAYDATIVVDADIGSTVQAYDATIMVDADIGVSVQAYDATYVVDADIGVSVQAYDATIVTSSDIGSAVQAYDATIVVDADIGVSVQAYDSTILVDADIGSTVQAYDATYVVDADIGSTVQAFDATIVVDADIGVSVQAYDATIVVDADLGVSVQAYDVDTAKLDVIQTYTASQRGAVTSLIDAASVVTNLALSNNFSLTLAGNRTLANPTNVVAGQVGSFFITQDGTGSRTLAYGSLFKFVGGTAPVLTTTAASVCRIDYAVKSATEIHAVASLDVK